MTLLGITRALEDINGLSAKARRMDIEIVALPVVTHTDVELTPDMIEIINASDWLFFTSSRGALSLVRGLRRARVSAMPQAKVAVVGERTRAVAERAGFSVSFVPHVSNAETLFTEFLEKYGNQPFRVAYVSAQDTHFDPAPVLSQAGFRYSRIVTYRSETQRISGSVAARFGDKDCILFTSPLAVRAYNAQLGRPTARVLAIGPSTANEITRAGWEIVATLPAPNVELALEIASLNNRTHTHAN